MTLLTFGSLAFSLGPLSLGQDLLEGLLPDLRLLRFSISALLFGIVFLSLERRTTEHHAFARRDLTPLLEQNFSLSFGITRLFSRGLVLTLLEGSFDPQCWLLESLSGLFSGFGAFLLSFFRDELLSV